MRIRRAFTATLAGALTLAMAACSSDTNNDDAEASSSQSKTSESGAFPVEIEHALGTTTISEKPERVATVAWGNQDVALALGVAPVGTDTQVWNWTGDADLGLYPWTTDALEELGAEDPVIFSSSDGVDFEAISDTNPDVILAAQSGLTQEDYDTLSEIAPVVAYPEIPWYTPWRDQILMNAKALGLESEGEQLVSDIDQQIEDATADATAIEGKSAAFFYINSADLSTVSLYTGGDPRTAFLGDLGFEMPQVAADAAEKGSFYLDITSENADQLADVDVIVSYGGEDLVTALQADPMWNTIPAVKNGAVVALGEGDAYSAAATPTALSIPWILEDYVAQLNDAAAKVQ
ncbi:iron-siderophore ABC transporter substrate-binding protein [Actinomycetaceae bacterium L2_0104]